MSRCFRSLVFVMIPTLFASAAEPGDRLDNGKDLTGWKGKLDGWSIVDGAIHHDAKAAMETITHEKTHSASCVIRLEFRATEAGDSGIYIHGKQFQIRDYPKAGPDRYARYAKPAGQWNTLELDFTGSLAVVRLNGEVIEKSWKIGPDPKVGLGLQHEKGDFDFRNITVREKK